MYLIHENKCQMEKGGLEPPTSRPYDNDLIRTTADIWFTQSPALWLKC